MKIIKLFLLTGSLVLPLTLSAAPYFSIEVPNYQNNFTRHCNSSGIHRTCNWVPAHWVYRAVYHQPYLVPCHWQCYSYYQ